MKNKEANKILEKALRDNRNSLHVTNTLHLCLLFVCLCLCVYYANVYAQYTPAERIDLTRANANCSNYSNRSCAETFL